MKKNTKKKIIKTAERLLWERGYDGSSLNDIVNKAGVSKGALFHYYPNKQAVSMEVLDKYTNEQLFVPIDKHLSSARSVKAGLMSWIEEIFNAYSQWNFRGGCLLGNFALELSDRDNVAREHMKQLFLQLENQLVSYLKPAAKDGKLLMEPRQFARLLIATLQGVTMTSKVHKDKIRASREFQALAELIERMIKG